MNSFLMYQLPNHVFCFSGCYLGIESLLLSRCYSCLWFDLFCFLCRLLRSDLDELLLLPQVDDEASWLLPTPPTTWLGVVSSCHVISSHLTCTTNFGLFWTCLGSLFENLIAMVLFEAGLSRGKVVPFFDDHGDTSVMLLLVVSSIHMDLIKWSLIWWN